ncbi:MAG: M48 family metallopeptidase, partial [Pseudomonadota bacterium]
MDLVSKHEGTLFRIGVVISAIFWLLLVGATFGIALVYLLLFFIFYLFAQSSFITLLKGNGVRISEKQYAELHQRVVRCCEQLEITEMPEAYLLRTDFFNALATKFLRRNYIVLFTDVVDALEKRPDAIDFYIGHELGHIDQKHLTWGWFLFPAMLLPILGAAYRRAQEYTCDRYGSACCNDENDIKAAIAAIAAGDTHWKSINTDAYLEQARQSVEFWMSF